MVTASNRLTFKEKFGYSLGDAASNLFWQFFTFYLLYFYTDVFGITGAAAGTMFLVARIFDTISDPVVGIISDRTLTKWGKYRPYILWFAVPFGILGILTFTTPALGSTGKLIWAYLTYSSMMLVYTLINIPYSALMAVISPKSIERTDAASFRFFAAFAAGLFVQATANPFVEFFGKGNEQYGWHLTLVVYGALAIFLWFLTFKSTRERVQPLQTAQSSIQTDIKDLFNNTPWIMLFVLTLFLNTYVSIRNGVIIYYFKYYVQNQTFFLFGHTTTFAFSKLSSSFMVLGSAANILGVLLTPWLTRVFGKRTTFIVSMFFTSLLTAFFYFFYPENIKIMFVFHFLISFLMGPLAPIIYSMYTDAVDYGEWKTGRRAAGLVMSASTMAGKLSWTFGGALTGWLLSGFGFMPNIDQSLQTLNGLRLMMSIIPAAFSIYGAGMMFFYKLDDKTLLKIENDLRKSRLQASHAPDNHFEQI